MKTFADGCENQLSSKHKHKNLRLDSGHWNHRKKNNKKSATTTLKNAQSFLHFCPFSSFSLLSKNIAHNSFQWAKQKCFWL